MIDELYFLRDCTYLFTLQGSNTHTFYKCVCKEVDGTGMFDTGSLTRNYVSKVQFEKLGVPMKESYQRNATLPNGQVMKVYGTTVLPVQLSEWQGDVEFSVLDMDTEFDYILGLPWHRENHPLIQWDTMIYEVEKDGRKCQIFPTFENSKAVELDEGGSINLITCRQARKILKDKRSEAVVYFVRDAQDTVDESDTFALVRDQSVSSQPPELKKLLDEFRDLFRASVPEHLPPRRGIEHEIETGDARPVNTRAYPLSLSRLKEQTKQVTELLEKGLI
jgi:hypothetical protein